MDEIWNSILGFEDRYEVSSYGRVRSLCRSKPIFLKPGTNKGNGIGYRFVQLGRGNMRYIHRLVLEAFVGPAPDGCEALHGPDPNPANNRLDNLRWGTRKDNMADAAPGMPESQRKRAIKMKQAGCVHLTEELVTKIRLNPGSNDWKWAKELNVPRYVIRSARNGNTWKHVKTKPVVYKAGRGRIPI